MSLTFKRQEFRTAGLNIKWCSSLHSYSVKCVGVEFLLTLVTWEISHLLTAYPQHRGELEWLEKWGMPKLCERKVQLLFHLIDTYIDQSVFPIKECVVWAEPGMTKMTVCPTCFLFNRTVDDKPKRPTRKRQAPEDFLGKGPDRKIFMGKYVNECRGGILKKKCWASGLNKGCQDFRFSLRFLGPKEFTLTISLQYL